MPTSIDDFFASCPPQPTRVHHLVRDFVKGQQDASGLATVHVTPTVMMLSGNALCSPPSSMGIQAS